MSELQITRVSPEEVNAADLNTPWTEIEQAVNGPNAAVPGDGLDDENFGDNFPVLTAATIAGLGATRPGKQGKLRIGSTPYDVIALVYDDGLGKWVSEQIPMIHQNDAETTANAAYTALPGVEMRRAFIPNLKAIYAAGLRPQVWTGGKLSNSGANTTRARVAIRQLNDGDTALSANVFTGGEIVNTVAAATYKIAAWAAMVLDSGAFPTGPSENHGLLLVEMNRTAGTGTMIEFSCWLRWVSA